MPTALDLVTLITTEHDRVCAVLRDVLGFEESRKHAVDRQAVNELFGWTGGGDGKVHTTFFGTEAHGLIEVVDMVDAVAPKAVEGAPPVGILHVCIIVDDVAETIEKAKAVGVDFTNGPFRFEGIDITFAAGIIRVGGIQFELSQTL